MLTADLIKSGLWKSIPWRIYLNRRISVVRYGDLGVGRFVDYWMIMATTVGIG